jgi:hypothetical protein
MAPKSEEIVPVFATEPSKIDTSLTKMPHVAYENAASRDPRRDLAYVADVAREGSDQLDLDAGGAGRNSAGAAIDDVAGEERSVFDENAVSARGNRARVTDAPAKVVTSLTSMPVEPAAILPLLLLLISPEKSEALSTKMPTRPVEVIVPALMMPPVKVVTSLISMPLEPATILPLLLLRISPEKSEALSTKMPWALVLDIIVPLLVIPPRKVVTVLRKMPVKAVEIVPLFVMPPRKVAAFT